MDRKVDEELQYIEILERTRMVPDFQTRLQANYSLTSSPIFPKIRRDYNLSIQSISVSKDPFDRIPSKHKLTIDQSAIYLESPFFLMSGGTDVI